MVLPGTLVLFGLAADSVGSFRPVLYGVGTPMLIGIAALYRWGPSRQQARWRWIGPGATLALVAILGMSMLFSWYAGNFAHYDKTYGSLGGLVGLLTWMWLSMTALLIGAELTPKRSGRRAMIQPLALTILGARRAAAADTVGRQSERKIILKMETNPERPSGYNAAVTKLRQPSNSWVS